jgi:hypothetical protein
MQPMPVVRAVILGLMVLAAVTLDWGPTLLAALFVGGLALGLTLASNRGGPASL